MYDINMYCKTGRQANIQTDRLDRQTLTRQVIDGS